MPQQKQSQQQNEYQSLNIPTPPPRREASDKSKPTPADKKAERDFVAELKAIAIDLDQGNQDKIIIYHGFKDWWQIGGRSLLFYFHYLMPEFGTRAIKPRPDTDYYCKWPANPGCASIHDIESIKNDLIQKAGCRPLLEHPSLLIYQLPHKFAQTEIDVYLSIKSNQEARVNSLILPKNLFPSTRNACDMLNKIVFDKIRNLEPFTRETIGTQIFEHTNWLAFHFVAMVNGHIDAEGFFKEAFHRLDLVQDWLVHTERYRIFDDHTRAVIAESTADIRGRLEKDLLQYRLGQSGEKPETKDPAHRSNHPADRRAPNRKPRTRSKNKTKADQPDLFSGTKTSGTEPKVPKGAAQ